MNSVQRLESSGEQDLKLLSINKRYSKSNLSSPVLSPNSKITN